MIQSNHFNTLPLFEQIKKMLDHDTLIVMGGPQLLFFFCVDKNQIKISTN